MIILFIVLLIASFYLLSKGSDFLVDGASSIAKKFGISPLVIGLTIVSFGTSAPELIVSLSSVIGGSGQIAVANILGSNIVNILFILGICAIIKPLTVKSSTVWKEIPLAVVAALSVLFLGFAEFFKTSNLSSLTSVNIEGITGYLSMAQGVILLIFFTIYMYYNFGIAKNTDEIEEIELENAEKNEVSVPNSNPIWYILGGLFLLIVGGQMAVSSAVEIAKLFGISERIIGLTIVAIGTSLPELLTSVKATLKGEVDIAIGNVVGSNIFNVFFILGISSLFGVLKLSGGELIDSLVGILAAIILFASTFVIKKSQIGKLEGIFMILTYFVYLGYLILAK